MLFPHINIHSELNFDFWTIILDDAKREIDDMIFPHVSVFFPCYYYLNVANTTGAFFFFFSPKPYPFKWTQRKN